MHLELLREGLVRYEPTAVPSYSSGPVGRRDGCVWGIGATRHAGAVRTECGGLAARIPFAHRRAPGESGRGADGSAFVDSGSGDHTHCAGDAPERPANSSSRG